MAGANRGPWIIAGAIVLSGALIVGTLFVLNDDPAPAIKSERVAPSVTPVSPSPSASPSPTVDPVESAEVIAETFHNAWVNDNRSVALAIGTRRAVNLQFQVPVENRPGTRLEYCQLNEDGFGLGAYQCVFAVTRGPAKGIYVFSYVVKGFPGGFRVDAVIFHDRR